MIDVCICTHNPRVEVLTEVIASIANQCVSGGLFRVVIIDNASVPPIPKTVLEPLVDKGITARIVIEPSLGIARARLRGIEETGGEWLLFVDDDNILEANYIVEGVFFERTHPKLGCFGGKLLLPSSIAVRGWAMPFLPYLAIKDMGETALFGTGQNWDQSEPPTAGAFVKRSVLKQYLREAENKDIFQLGRVGSSNLGSCEDSLMMRGVHRLGLLTGYNPRMVLKHRLDKKRFSLRYLVRLMYAYGVSHVRLDSLIAEKHSVPNYYLSTRSFLLLLIKAIRDGSRQSLAFGLGMAAYHFGARTEHLQQSTTVQNPR